MPLPRTHGLRNGVAARRAKSGIGIAANQIVACMSGGISEKCGKISGMASRLRCSTQQTASVLYLVVIHSYLFVARA